MSDDSAIAIIAVVIVKEKVMTFKRAQSKIAIAVALLVPKVFEKYLERTIQIIRIFDNIIRIKKEKKNQYSNYLDKSY